MKKLRIKVFFTIFIIFSIFALSLIILCDVREYSREKHSIESILKHNVKKNDYFNDISTSPSISDFESYNKEKEIFIDYEVYNVIFDNDSYDIEVILTTDTDSKGKISLIEKKATFFKKRGDRTKVNLLFSNYSYNVEGNVVTIIDNSYQSSELHEFILVTSILFLLIELLSYFVSKFLTEWITKPVLESFNREKRFIGDASHELKTPIAVIMASADAYQADKDNKWIENIKSESDRMNKLITDLLDLSKLENEKDFEKENINLSKLVESSLLPYECLFYENNLKFNYELSENIYFKCNANSIKELISILIDNAIKYSVKKGMVDVKLYRDKDIYLLVSNKGEAISEADREKIFERFYKVDKSRNRKSNNYGLGLSIAKQIVNLHDGEISAESKGGITTFKVRFKA